jgi:hypothetical protein
MTFISFKAATLLKPQWLLGFRVQIQTRLGIGVHWQVQGSDLHASHSHLHVRRVGLAGQSVFFLLASQLPIVQKSAVVLCTHF